MNDDEAPYTLADLPSIEKYLRIRCRAYQWQADWEDCIQEGVIYAWKDITGDRAFTRAHLRNRAAQRIRAVATSNHHPFTGTPERTRTGTYYGELSPMATKVGSFIDEYAALHDGYMPSGRAIADATGCPMGEVKRYIAQVRGRRGSYTSVLLKDGKVDRKAYRMLPLDGWGPSPFEADTTPEITAASGQPSFETGTVDDIAYRQMINDVFGDDERTVQILALYVHDGYSQREIGERFNLSQPRVGRIIRGALNKVRAYYESDGTQWR
ncbi:sigma factor-like helix-turn-helix DNA-binding protein [Streptomyces sp. I8-5]|uniref:sigma factor-like helix-turn-helix DNA-binding protein n=1 Tax=Streptomyces sp. I8-5 TaxID=3104277 RepID=UPI0038668022